MIQHKTSLFVLRRENVQTSSPRSLDRHVRHPIIGFQQTIIHIIRWVIIQGWQLMKAPANHEADMMGALQQHSWALMWGK